MFPSNDQAHDSRLQSSNARLRTRSGCGECRRRRKKCDEKRPQCGGCTRNRLECKWPAEYQPVDRRRCPRSSGTHKSPPSAVSTRVVGGSGAGKANSVPACSPGAYVVPSIPMPEPFGKKEHMQLYQYFAHSITPRLVRQSSLSRYSDDSHILRLALSHAPLMGALVAIAAMHISPQLNHRVALGVESYIFAIKTLKDGILNAKYAGNEDWLLATTTFLCLFENTRCDSMPNAGSHILASGRILSLRTPKPRNSPQESLVFERVCIESFLYHAVLMTLFDPSIDCHSIIRGGLDVDGYFSDPVHPDDARPGTLTSTQPVLDASYKFFLLIADVTKLARSAFNPDLNHLRTLDRLLGAFGRWEQINGGNEEAELDNHIGNLFAISIPILTALASYQQDMTGFSTSVGDLFQRGLRIIMVLGVDEWFSYYYLWPILVLGSVATTRDDRQTFREKLNQISQLRHTGPIALAKYRLEKVWGEGSRFPSDCGAAIILAQLRTLLNDESQKLI